MLYRDHRTRTAKHKFHSVLVDCCYSELLDARKPRLWSKRWVFDFQEHLCYSAQQFEYALADCMQCTKVKSVVYCVRLYFAASIIVFHLVISRRILRSITSFFSHFFTIL